VARPANYNHLIFPLKTFYLRKEFETWLLSENLPLTPSGKIKRSSASKLAEWVSAVWKKIAGRTVEPSFKKCCITNALDGTEDDI
jgi:hypothetical protein